MAGSRLVAGALALASIISASGASETRAQETSSVIFFHPDGMGVNHWTAVRLLEAGPDGRLHWDRLPHMAVYTGHMADQLVATSHGGATVHAYGVKVHADSYGTDGGEPLVARSGYPGSILMEALDAGLAAGIINSGTITEPGSGVFAASVRSRYSHAEIVSRILEVGPHVILGGGERFFLPRGVRGVHGAGARTDGRDLVEEARSLGYTVVYDRAGLKSLPDTVGRVLGLFASHHTFNASSEEGLRASVRETYLASAPSVAEMVEAALRVLSRSAGRFFLAVEEEGTDNFANDNNASGALEAGRRADDAIGTIRTFIVEHPETTLVVTSDSDAGGMQVVDASNPDGPLPERTGNGAPLDGAGGTGTAPFLAAPDRRGSRWPFAVAWVTENDTAGGILVRAAGLHGDLVGGTFDSTDVYRAMYRALFGRFPDQDGSAEESDG